MVRPSDRPTSPLDPALPIGVFDSGLGGLTVVRALAAALPEERICYLGDTARVPYGTRSADTVVRYARGCARLLSERGIKALVVACNTVSAVALEVLQAELPIPVIGVIDPGAAAAVRLAVTLPALGGYAPKIGVLGTRGTVRSGAYLRAVSRYSSRFEVVAQAAPLLVPLVEEGWLTGPVPEQAVSRYLEPLLEQGARLLVLGCTHYPVLSELIAQQAARIAGVDVPIVDSALATARAVAQLFDDGRVPTQPQVRRSFAPVEAGSLEAALTEAARLHSQPPPPPLLELLVTDAPDGFAASAQRFLGVTDTPDVTLVDLPT